MTDTPNLFTPVDPHLPPSEVSRLTPANRRLLDALRAGPRTGMQLVAVCGVRYGARLHDLRQHGYRISSTQVAGGEWVYALVQKEDAA